jgi:diamine N-acetyltransferase
MNFSGESIYLRPVEKDDAAKLMLWENNTAHWKVSGTEVPCSFFAINEYIEQAQNIRSHGQLRMMICLKDSQEPIGTVDLYQADFKNRRASIGILIASESHKNQGYAYESLVLMHEFAAKFLDFHNLACSIQADNEASIRLFEKAGYEFVGIRKDWFMINGKWTDEIIYQKCLKKD